MTQNLVAIPKPLKDGYALYGEYLNRPDELAAIAEVTVAQVEATLADPEKFAELEAYRAAQQMLGKTQPVRVRKLVGMTLDVIEEHLKTGCDLDAALEIIKPLIRLTEVSERTRLAEREVDDVRNLAVIHITIGRPAEKRVSVDADVIDVHALQISPSAGGAL